MDKVKFLKDVEVPSVKIGDILLSTKRVQGLLAILGLNTVSNIYEITEALAEGEIFSNINFTSNGKTFSSMSIKHVEDEAWGNHYQLYYDNTCIGNTAHEDTEFQFVQDEYSIIDFGATPQEILSEELTKLNKIGVKYIKLGGTWCLDDYVNRSYYDKTFKISFVSNGTKFDSINLVYNSVYFNDTLVCDWGEDIDGNETFGYTNYAYRTLEIEDQYVSPTLYSWLKTNAQFYINVLVEQDALVKSETTWREFGWYYGNMINFGCDGYDRVLLWDSRLGNNYELIDSNGNIVEPGDIITPFEYTQGNQVW